jgi:hypothetical protein
VKRLLAATAIIGAVTGLASPAFADNAVVISGTWVLVPAPAGGGGGTPPVVDNTLPGQPPVVDNTLPGSQPGPDNTLPAQPPAPDNTLPPTQPGAPDQGLPQPQPPTQPVYPGFPVGPLSGGF